MFRLQENMPQVYINKSRDFQLLCHLYDLWQSGIKYGIDIIPNSLDPMRVPDTLLEYLATRVGFFSSVTLDSNVLRYIISAFPYIIKNKGTETGIRAAVNTILKAENDPKAVYEVIVTIVNKSDSDQSSYNVEIQTKNDIYNKLALRELLKYVLPFGYTYSLSVYNAYSTPTITVDVNSSVSSAIVKTQRLGFVPSSQDNINIENPPGVITNNLGTYNTTYVVGSQNDSSNTLEDYPSDGESVINS